MIIAAAETGLTIVVGMVAFGAVLLAIIHLLDSACRGNFLTQKNSDLLAQKMQENEDEKKAWLDEQAVSAYRAWSRSGYSNSLTEAKRKSAEMRFLLTLDGVAIRISGGRLILEKSSVQDIGGIIHYWLHSTARVFISADGSCELWIYQGSESRKPQTRKSSYFEQLSLTA